MKAAGVPRADLAHSDLPPDPRVHSVLRPNVPLLPGHLRDKSCDGQGPVLEAEHSCDMKPKNLASESAVEKMDCTGGGA